MDSCCAFRFAHSIAFDREKQSHSVCLQHPRCHGDPSIEMAHLWKGEVKREKIKNTKMATQKTKEKVGIPILTSHKSGGISSMGLSLQNKSRHKTSSD